MLLLVNFFAIAALGFAFSYHIYLKRGSSKSMTCLFGSDCDSVITSKWGTRLGLRNEVWAMLFYVVVIIALLVAYIIPSITPYAVILVVLLSAMALLYSFYLLGVQLFVLKQSCSYCLISALVVVVFGINVVLLL